MAADGGGLGGEALAGDGAVIGVESVAATLGDAAAGVYMPGPAMPASLDSASNISAGMLLLTIGSHRSHSAVVLIYYIYIIEIGGNEKVSHK